MARTALSGDRNRFSLHLRGANLAIPAAMLVYAAGCGVLCRALGHAGDFRPGIYLAPFYASYGLAAAVIAVALLVRRLLGNDRQPLLWFKSTWPIEEFFSRLIGALPFLLAWPVFMAGFTAIKNLWNETLPFAWDQDIVALGAKLPFSTQLWHLVAFQNPPVTRAIEFVYAFWGVPLVAVPFMICLRPPTCPKRTRYLISQLLVMILLGNVAAGAFMSAGPFWLDLTDPQGSPYTALFGYLQRLDPDGPFSAALFQRYLWDAYQHRIAWFGSGISAFPSIHVAVAALYVLAGWPFGGIARVASAFFLGVIMIGSVHLGWHYALDGYAGMAGAGAIYYGVGRLQRRYGSAAREPLTAPTLSA
jgi:hypothetical protein